MGNTCKCSCVGKTKDYINRELKKRKKPPRPEEYKIEEGKQVTDGKVLTESMRLNLSETHPDKRKETVEMNRLTQTQAYLNKSEIPANNNGVQLNKSGILNSEYKNVSEVRTIQNGK